LVIKTPLQKLVAGGYTARRVVVDTNSCESCHEQLGTAVDFHGGARNDATACAICHNTNRTSNGWSANASTFIHGIHAGTDPASVTAANAVGAATVGNPGSGAGGAGPSYSSGKRYVPFSWARSGAATALTWNAASVVYPGILKRCENCHVPNAVNFGASGATLLPNLLWSTTGTGKYKYLATTDDASRVYPRDPVTGAVIYINANNAWNYGNLFSYTPVGSVVASYTSSISGVAGTATSPALAVAPNSAKPYDGILIAASSETLVESPVTAACFACHDSGVAKAHMNQYGGVMGGASAAWSKGTRAASTVSGVLTNSETCLVCHGMGRDQDAAVVHAKK
jgi:OmcA/MtrC family decaheme c-type cytochrome